MKKLATILVLLFVMVQVVPTVYSIFSVQTSLFLIDEEKSPEKTEKKDIKEIKNIIYVPVVDKLYAQKIQTAFQLADRILISPSLEKHTPPPDFI